MTVKRTAMGYQLPLNPENSKGRIAQGFATPKQDRSPQIQSIPPKRVLPIVFIPGIMGSNLRMSSAKQNILGAKSNIAWRPDNSSVTLAQFNDSPIERQLRLDPETTEVDSYDPLNSTTGNAAESADSRNDSVTYRSGYRGWGKLEGPMLQADPPTVKGGRTQNQKARQRGWGEIFYGSYESLLSICESKLNSAFYGGVMDLYLRKNIVEVEPSKWLAHPGSEMKALDEKKMRDSVKGCWFPVHAMGYNWLRGNAESGSGIAKRISKLIDSYSSQGFQCEKVILVTHSMGGLVARAVIHPQIGNVGQKILGIIHGVMPAMGAGAAYKRMRCGVEGSGVSGSITADVLGDNAKDVTAVLADAQGALELLPSKSYGSHWLQVSQNGKIIKSWPEKCPYEEIYKAAGKWYSLFREDFINPAQLDYRGFLHTVSLLEDAKIFHEQIANTYHEQSYAHYGVDSERKAWHKVVWKIDENIDLNDIDKFSLVEDDSRGKMKLLNKTSNSALKRIKFIEVSMMDAADPGDQTVPSHSADAQLHSKKFKGVFRQKGYEHQASYSDGSVLAATMYCLFNIISTMKWSEK